MNIHQPRTTRLTNTCHAGTGPTTALKTCKYNLPIWTVLCLLPSHLSKRTRPPSLEGEKKPLPPKNLSLPKILSTIALPAKFGEPCPLSSALLLRMPPKPFPSLPMTLCCWPCPSPRACWITMLVLLRRSLTGEQLIDTARPPATPLLRTPSAETNDVAGSENDARPAALAGRRLRPYCSKRSATQGAAARLLSLRLRLSPPLWCRRSSVWGGREASWPWLLKDSSAPTDRNTRDDDDLGVPEVVPWSRSSVEPPHTWLAVPARCFYFNAHGQEA